jgi:hypothetical protein
MGTRITSVTSPAFDELFASFKHTAYRLETLQRYDVSYEIEPYRAFLAGQPRPHDSSKSAWTAMLKASAAAGKVVQRVHLVNEPLTDYLRYELEWSYPPNVEAGEDIRILPAGDVSGVRRATLAALGDYWLFDSSDLWVMEYDDEGRFRSIEQASGPSDIVLHARWRDAALHHAIPYADYMRDRELLAAS